MIIAPISNLDVVIRDTLREVRRGVATARAANQADPTAGLMADLPEFVDFEIQVITGYQLLARDNTDTDAGSVTETSMAIDSGRDSTTDTGTGSESSSGSRSGSESGSSSRSKSGSRSGSQSRSSSGSKSGSRSGSKSGSMSQSSSSSRSGSGSSSQSSSGSRSDSRSGRRSGSLSRSNSQSNSSSRSGSQSASQSNSGKNITQDQSDNGRSHGIIDEDTGEYTASGDSGISGQIPPTPREATASCGV